MKFDSSAPTRRQAVAGIAAAAAGSAFAARAHAIGQQTPIPEKSAKDGNDARTSLHQQIDLPAAPKRVFEVLMDAKQFAIVTGLSAEIDPKAGGTFKTFGGLIEGRNVELIPGQRIVQAWREASWEAGFYSLVHIELIARSKETTLILDHTGFHDGDFVHLDPGWHERYWEPLKKYLEVQG